MSGCSGVEELIKMDHDHLPAREALSQRGGEAAFPAPVYAIDADHRSSIRWHTAEHSGAHVDKPTVHSTIIA